MSSHSVTDTFGRHSPIFLLTEPQHWSSFQQRTLDLREGWASTRRWARDWFMTVTATLFSLTSDWCQFWPVKYKRRSVRRLLGKVYIPFLSDPDASLKTSLCIALGTRVKSQQRTWNPCNSAGQNINTTKAQGKALKDGRGWMARSWREEGFQKYDKWQGWAQWA